MKKRFACFDFKERDLNENGYLVEIGNGVWIGSNVLVKEGITIGDGAVIGMGSVVTKNVPPYAVVGGNTAKIIKYHFDESTIERLFNTKWFYLSDDEIMKLSTDFADVSKFLDKTEKDC